MDILRNRWFKFALWTLFYVLVFVVWMHNWWMLVGVAVIFDIFITKFLSRYVVVYHKRARAKNSLYNVIAEWGEAIIFAVIVASLVHILVFQMYVIPTSSMEKSLLVGDYLYVSKLTYGPKMPNTPLSLPLVHNTMPGSKTGAKSYSEAIRLPYKRLSGLKKIKRDDVVVFNFPAGDTVMLGNTNVTYYDYERHYGRAYLENHYKIVARPVDKRDNYVKRCVAIPGDTIRIVASQLYVNGIPQKEVPGLQQKYRIRTSSAFPYAVLDEMGINMSEFDYYQNSGVYDIPLTAADLEKMRSMSNVIGIDRIESRSEAFPHTAATGWTGSDFGPLWIPARGATVALTLDNLPLYERIIDAYEENDLEVRDGVIYINGAPASEYTFRMDYYWMMGDNRQNSADSRFWGFVPEDHIVGKASFVWLSLDKNKGWFDGKIRWNKMFRKIR